MEDYYEINVTRDGRHYFATAPRSLNTNEAEARAIFDDIRVRFPASDGFSATLYLWTSRGKVVAAS